MSAPATNVRPAPITTAALTAGSLFTASIAVEIPSGTPGLRALTGGLSMVMTATSLSLLMLTRLVIPSHSYISWEHSLHLLRVQPSKRTVAGPPWYFFRISLFRTFSAAHNNVLLAIYNQDVSTLRNHGHVAGVKPSAPHSFGRGFRLLPVTRHHSVTASDDFSHGHAVARHVLVLRVDHS